MNFRNGDPASVWRRARPRFDAGTDRAERLLAEAGCGTRDHSHEVASLAGAIAERLGLHADERRRVTATARLHDIGKSLLPASLIDKPGPLGGGEWELMHLHTVVGERLVVEIGESRYVARAVRHSHERWDGRGYPDGLRGSEIPLASRIVLCADAFDAICSDRPYRVARSEAEGLAEIRRCAGSQFDPRIVEALSQVIRPRLHRAPHEGRRRRGRPAGVLVALAAGMIGVSLAVLGHSNPSTSEAEPLALASASDDRGEIAEGDPLAPPALGELGATSVAARGKERETERGSRGGARGDVDQPGTPPPFPEGSGEDGGPALGSGELGAVGVSGGGHGHSGSGPGGGHSAGNGPGGSGNSGGVGRGGSGDSRGNGHGGGNGHGPGGGRGHRGGGGGDGGGGGSGSPGNAGSSNAPGQSGAAPGQVKSKG